MWVPPMWGIKTHVGYINIYKKRAGFSVGFFLCSPLHPKDREKNKKEKMQKVLEAIQFLIKSSDQRVFVVRLS